MPTRLPTKSIKLSDERWHWVRSHCQGRSTAEQQVGKTGCLAVRATSGIGIESVDGIGARIRRFLDIDGGGRDNAADAALISEPMLRHACDLFAFDGQIIGSGTIGVGNRTGAGDDSDGMQAGLNDAGQGVVLGIHRRAAKGRFDGGHLHGSQVDGTRATPAPAQDNRPAEDSHLIERFMEARQVRVLPGDKQGAL